MRIHKAIRDITDQLSGDAKDKALGVGELKVDYRANDEKILRGELQKIISEMEKQMKEAAKNLDFEKAAAFRDEMYELKAILARRQLQTVGTDQVADWRRIGTRV